jgi:putative transposase
LEARKRAEEPHRDRGKQGAKINLLVDERGAPLSVVLSGANRHDKISAVDVIVSIVLKRPALTRSSIWSSICAPTKPMMPQR